jgi:hypothetical protein
MSHTCHARGCDVPCKPELLMCRRHWGRVPRVVQQDVWKHYRPGQCDDKDPSPAWHRAADAAIGAVAVKELRPISKNELTALLSYGFNEARLAQGTVVNRG